MLFDTPTLEVIAKIWSSQETLTSRDHEIRSQFTVMDGRRTDG